VSAVEVAASGQVGSHDLDAPPIMLDAPAVPEIPDLPDSLIPDANLAAPYVLDAHPAPVVLPFATPLSLCKFQFLPLFFCMVQLLPRKVLLLLLFLHKFQLLLLFFLQLVTWFLPNIAKQWW